MSDACARHDQLLEYLSWISQHIDQLIIPVLGCRAYKLSCGCLCVLASFFACKKKMEVVRYMKKCLSLLQILRMFLLHCHQLIYCIVDRFLDTGSCIQILQGNCLINFLVHSLCTMITVAYRVAKNLVILVKKYEVNTPGINTHAYRDLADLFTFLKTIYDLGEKAVKLPAELSILLNHAVLKTIDFFQDHFSVFHMSQNVTSTGCSDIYC